MAKPAITDLSPAQLNKLMASWGEPAFRVAQLQEWVYRSKATSFDEMTNLPQSLRERLGATASLQSLVPISSVTSADGRTTKTLFHLKDAKTIESVFMSYDPMGQSRGRRTVCASTQVGCAFGCLFCATGQMGFERNLTAGEIVDQVLYFARMKLAEAGSRGDEVGKRPPLTNVVFMGMGEPLVNYKATLQAIANLNAYFGLGARHMTISTVGLVPQIKRLAREGLQVGLAISLHAPNDELRRRLVPVAQRYPLKKLIDACQYYVAETGRHVTFEYVLLTGINDSPRQASELAHLLKGLNCHVNLIPANPFAESQFRAPPRESIKAFQQELNRHHIPTTLRVERGASIAAGCGQLRSRLSATS